MFPGEGLRDRLTTEDLKTQYQDAFSRLIKLYGFDQEDAQGVERVIDFPDGYHIWADYKGPTWMQIRVTLGQTKVLSFVMRGSGLESVGFMTPSLVIGENETKLGKIGIGLREERLHAVNYGLEESDNMDRLGIQLVDWIVRSDEDRVLKPLDIGIKLPLLPQER